MIFENRPTPQSPLREAIINAYRRDETQCVEDLLKIVHFSESQLANIKVRAEKMVVSVREKRLRKGGLDGLLYQYDLSSDEGIALMCLAEALLRIPDKETIDHLIRDKVTAADWQSNVGRSDSILTNAATWGLMLTGKILTPSKETSSVASALKNLIGRTGEPIIRKALGEAVKILGRQFILGRTIDEALSRGQKSKKLGYRFSYDMLGEAARTDEDALRYHQSYISAIHAIGKNAGKLGPIHENGISVKLSALHPRYEWAKREQVIPILVERVHELAKLAKQYNIGMTVDAEESDRLVMSLDIICEVFAKEDLQGWEGFGLAVQAYQKRAPFVIDWLIALSQKHKKKLMVRLVKGAYWDTEIKDSQVRGLKSYPVYTRKVGTDVSYLACATKMINAKNEIFPQFATHNAHTVCALLELLGERKDFEFQCLQGMGKVLYDDIVDPQKDYGIPCRIYAPVGSHQDLLPYLVRRLLENGANTSFVNRIVDENAPIADLISDPVQKLKDFTQKSHPKIPLPRELYGTRLNSLGIDLSSYKELTALADQLEPFTTKVWEASPSFMKDKADRKVVKIVEPRDNRNEVGNVTLADKNDVEDALDRAEKAYYSWSHLPPEERANCLDRAADLYEEHRAEFIALAIREAGKTIPDAVSEVREAVDFCRYYAEQARLILANKTMPGPTGETNVLQMHGRGIIVCISPWNFPLAIFTGQVVAALVTGNAVIAKPSEQTVCIAAKAVSLLHQAGIPKEILQLMPGPGSVIGTALVNDLRTAGVVFTGSTQTAQIINANLAKRNGALAPLIAETGGQNAMIADSSALPEQLVMDVIISAFHSASQRCSALRVLYIQEDIADKVITMLRGAMEKLVQSDPAYLSTDIGPVIDAAAKKMLEDHFELMCKEGKLIYQIEPSAGCGYGSYFAPCAFEIANIGILKQEVFGPILHVIRFKRGELDKVIDEVNSTGYGLTLGIHSRIDTVADYIQQRVRAGNAYVNRNMVGAVVGVQPFGGENLSGTGPKAGGPHYLPRLCTERTLSINTSATGGNATLLSLID